jgi:hypothetical protein
MYDMQGICHHNALHAHVNKLGKSRKEVCVLATIQMLRRSRRSRDRKRQCQPISRRRPKHFGTRHLAGRCNNVAVPCLYAMLFIIKTRIAPK